MMIESYKATFNDVAEGQSKPKEKTKSYSLEFFIFYFIDFGIYYYWFCRSLQAGV